MILLPRLLASSPNLSRFEVPFLSDNDLRLLALHCGSSLRTVISRSSVITAAAVSELCTSCPNLKIFYHGTNYSKASEDDIILAVVQGCPDIEFTCTINSRITNTAMISLSNIHTLKIFRICHQNLSSTAIHRVLRANTNLTEVYLIGSFIDNYLVSAIGSYCRNLIKLELSSGLSSSPLTDVTYLTLFRGCPLLEVFKLSQAHSMSDRSLRAMFQHCQHLTELQFNMPDREKEVTSGEYIPILGAYYPSLTSLEVLNDGLPDLALRDIFTHCTELWKVTLNYCLLINDDTMIILAHNCTNLGVLYLGRNRACDTGAGNNSCPTMTLTGMLQVVSLCSNLVVLSLDRMPISDEVLTRLSQTCPGLEQLFITQCDGLITEVGVSTVLDTCKELTYVSIDCSLDRFAPTIDIKERRKMYPRIRFDTR